MLLYQVHILQVLRISRKNNYIRHRIIKIKTFLMLYLWLII